MLNVDHVLQVIRYLSTAGKLCLIVMKRGKEVKPDIVANHPQSARHRHPICLGRITNDFCSPPREIRRTVRRVQLQIY